MAIDFERDIVLRWDDQDPAVVPLLREGGITAVLVPELKAAFREACAAARIQAAPPADLLVTGIKGLREAGGPLPTSRGSDNPAEPRAAASGAQLAAFGSGLWPGISRGPNSSEIDVASASRQPWVDANGFRIAWLRALVPRRHPVLAYLPNADAGLSPERIVPFESLELALVEAWVNGGNYVLAVEPRYRAALLGGNAGALAAWRGLGRTSLWLREHRLLFGRPVFPQITALVDESEESAEILNLLFRQNASPAVCAVDALPAPDPKRRMVVVAAGIAAPDADARRRILAHAAAGATVVAETPAGSEPWWRRAGMKLERDEPDRATWRLGQGRVVAYKDTISDPSDFALDVIDLVTHRRRAVRLWNALSAIAIATAGGEAARAAVIVVNYGRAATGEAWGRGGSRDVLVQVDGEYSRAELLQPGADRAVLKTAARGGRTEVVLPRLGRAAVILLG